MLNILQRLSRAELALLDFSQTVDEGQDPYSRYHCHRVAAISAVLGGILSLSHDDQFALYCGGYLHDIGKVGIPDAIRFKVARLDSGEFAIMTTHATIGYEICKPIITFAQSLPIIRSHHEKWNGTGYPDGLAGTTIPLLARLFQIVDIYDALTAPRPYRPGMSYEEALGAMTVDACDHTIVRAFASLPIEAHEEAMNLFPAVSRTESAKSAQTIERYSCFISHSSNDAALAQRLNDDLRAHGVTCWYAPEDLRIGDLFRLEIEESIEIHDKVLLILSSSSVASTWVESEVEAALEEERRRLQALPEGMRGNTTVLFPIRIDDSIETTRSGWAAHVRRSRHIGDFRGWQDLTSYSIAMRRLLRDLAKSDEADREARKTRRLASAALG